MIKTIEIREEEEEDKGLEEEACGKCFHYGEEGYRAFECTHHQGKIGEE